MENKFLDIDINERCAFCPKSFTCLRSFITHLDENCKGKKEVEKNKNRLNREQRLTITCKDHWCKHSTEQLNQQLAKIKGTKDEERSVARHTRSYSNEVMKGARMGATPDSSAPTGNNGDEGDEGSSDAASLSLIGTGTESYNNEATKAISTRGMPGPSLPAPRDCGRSKEDGENKEISAWPMNVGDIRRALSPEDPLRRLSSPSELLEGLLPSTVS